MLRNRLYYGVKPAIPAGLRWKMKRWAALRKRDFVSDRWPVLPGSEQPPAGWKGWPNGKKFALVLTHDVESELGVRRCQRLLRLEKELGYRSSFNFVPEGDYSVSTAMRNGIENEGFEIGVHDLRHDGKLYQNREEFAQKASRINHHLRQWGAVGYRSGFMFHNLDWHLDLDIKYDASTFDTDPFEPQPDGAHTIFPFWKEGPGGRGYVELPYTLPQDSTLYLVFGETSPAIWREKLDWIAQHGGMALVNVHPDYLAFSDEDGASRTYPVSIYEEFLRYARRQYGEVMWMALPREVAAFVAPQKLRHWEGNGEGKSSRTIWIDMDNTPHVPLFAPVVRELSRRGYQVALTARDAFQVCELAEKKKLRCVKIGRHHGKNKIRKVAGLFYRAAQLAPVVYEHRPALGLSHGSRSQILLCNLLGIPTVLMADYEYAQYPPLMKPTWEMVPEVIPNEALSCGASRVRKYPGIKEDIYVPDFKPNPAFRAGMGIGGEAIVAVVRPPATEAHYHNPEAELLFARFMERATRAEGVSVVLLPRNKKQGDAIRTQWGHWFREARTIVPQGAVDGLDLIYHADLVVSGGGTMNREAAALGVPVYSIFRGRIGAVDRHLEKEGRLTLVNNNAEVDQIPLQRRKHSAVEDQVRPPALARVVENIIEILERGARPDTIA